MRKYRRLHIRKAERLSIGGQRPSIKALYFADLAWRSYICDVPLPPRENMFTFDLKVGPVDLLVLDTYGDEVVLGSFRKRLLSDSKVSTTIAIDKKTGHMYFLGFGLDGNRLVAVIWRSPPNGSFEWSVPVRFLKKLNEVRRQKRPFCISVEPSALVAFHERTIGYNELTNNLILSLRFEKFALELWGDRSWRKVSYWK